MASRGRLLSAAEKVAREARRVGRKIAKFQVIKRPFLSSNVNFAAVREKYQNSELSGEPDTFALWRIIGNDLPPRHGRRQSRDNVAFILENEPELPGCTKHWLLNRIFDEDERRAIVDLLERHRQSYHCIPFDLDEYARQPLDLPDLPHDVEELRPHKSLDYQVRLRRLKNNYAINNNGARNAALRLSKPAAKWVLPWDGNCFLTLSAWNSIYEEVLRQPYLPYFMVPMTRVSQNSRLLDPSFSPTPVEEPQVIFRRDASETFDERYPYGRRPKVELLWRLAVPGPWDGFPIEAFDLPKPAPSPEAGQFARAGWVARLASGRAELETGRKHASARGAARNEAIIAFLDMLDSRLA